MQESEKRVIQWKPVRDVLILVLSFGIIFGFMAINEADGALRLADILFGTLLGLLGTRDG